MSDRFDETFDCTALASSDGRPSRSATLEDASTMRTGLASPAERATTGDSNGPSGPTGRRSVLKTVAAGIGGLPLFGRAASAATGSFDKVNEVTVGSYYSWDWQSPHVALIAEQYVSDSDRHSQYHWLKGMFDSVVNEWGYLNGIKLTVWQSYNDVEGASRSAREYQYDHDTLKQLSSLWILAQEGDVKDGAGQVGSACFTYDPSPNPDDHTDITIAWTNDWNSDKEWIGCHELGHSLLQGDAIGHKEHDLGTERLGESTPMHGNTNKPCPSAWRPSAKTRKVSSCTAEGMEQTANWAENNC